MRVARFESQIRRTTDCWIWTGHTRGRYGQYAGRQAHRVSFELSRGPIPEGLELDHLCRNTLCVNPEHLDPVDRAENVRRRYAAYTPVQQCIKGHAFDEANTYHAPDGRRTCRACNLAAALRWKARRARAAA